MRLDFENTKRCVWIYKEETFNIKIEGKKLEFNVKSDMKLDNGVKFKVGPVKYSNKITSVFLNHL